MGKQQHHKGRKRRRGWHRTGREDRHWLFAVRIFVTLEPIKERSMGKDSRRPGRKARHERGGDYYEVRCPYCTDVLDVTGEVDRSIEDGDGVIPMHPACAERLKARMRHDCPVCRGEGEADLVIFQHG